MAESRPKDSKPAAKRKQGKQRVKTNDTAAASRKRTSGRKKKDAATESLLPFGGAPSAEPVDGPVEDTLGSAPGL
jgi:hypothetical protein